MPLGTEASRGCPISHAVFSIEDLGIGVDIWIPLADRFKNASFGIFPSSHTFPDFSIPVATHARLTRGKRKGAVLKAFITIAMPTRAEKSSGSSP